MITFANSKRYKDHSRLGYTYNVTGNGERECTPKGCQ